MTELPEDLNLLKDTSDYDIMRITDEIAELATQAGYNIVERNDTKPWGAYLRFASNQANMFVGDFHNDLSPEEARLGNPDAELSPKIIIVLPDERLSLQTHERRAERWRFLTRGFYYKGKPGEEAQLYEAQPGEVVQFDRGDVHRLCGVEGDFVIVAEVWQHTDPNHPSDEDDIERLEDDYSRIV